MSDEHNTYEAQEAREVQEMLGRIPGWGLRWGITAVFFVVLLLLILSWIVRYPDVVSAQIMLLTQDPPLRLVAQSSGKLDTLLVEAGEEVQAGAMLALIENTAELEDVFVLEQWLNKNGVAKAGPLSSFPANLQLGPLQSTYARLQVQQANYQFFTKQIDVVAQVHTLRKRIQFLDSLNQVLDLQEITLSREVELAKNNYTRYKELNKDRDRNVSKVELESLETYYLQYKRKLQGLRANQLRNKIEQEQLQADIIRLEQGRTNLDVDQALEIQNTLELLRSELAAWKQAYLLIAPIDGQIIISRLIAAGQYFEEDTPVLAISPLKETQNVIARGYLPAIRSGKVAAGMTANIHLDAYPYQEYGVLKGKLTKVAPLPEENQYLIEISLADSLITTYNRLIPFSQEQSGRADLLTEDRRLLVRLLDNIMSLIKNT